MIHFWLSPLTTSLIQMYFYWNSITRLFNWMKYEHIRIESTLNSARHIRNLKKKHNSIYYIKILSFSLWSCDTPQSQYLRSDSMLSCCMRSEWQWKNIIEPPWYVSINKNIWITLQSAPSGKVTETGARAA